MMDNDRPPQWAPIDAIFEKVVACAVAIEVLCATPSNEQLERVRVAYQELVRTGYCRTGHDIFAADRPFEFRGHVTTSVSNSTASFCASILWDTWQLARGGALSPEEISTVLAKYELDDLWVWIGNEYSIALGKALQQSFNNVPQTAPRSNPLRRKISVPLLWDRVKGQVDPSGNPVATNRRTIYDWTDEEGFPSDMYWDDVRNWVNENKFIDIGECG